MQNENVLLIKSNSNQNLYFYTKKPPSSSKVNENTAKTGSDGNDVSIERKPDNNNEEDDNDGGKALKETVSSAYQTRTVPLGATYSSSSSLSLNDTSFSYPRKVSQVSFILVLFYSFADSYFCVRNLLKLLTPVHQAKQRYVA